jgi:hypothetical protein
MAKIARLPLSDATVSAATPREKAWKLTDSHGLFVLVNPSGGKWWRFKYRFGGKEKSLALGVFPETGGRPQRDVTADLRGALPPM